LDPVRGARMKIPKALAAELARQARIRAVQPVYGTKPGELALATVQGWCRARGWPVPVGEHRFHDTRRWRFDAAWPDLMLALEFQGGEWVKGRHTRPKGYAKDCEKFSVAAAMGWRVMPVTYTQLKSGDVLVWLELAFDKKDR